MSKVKVGVIGGSGLGQALSSLGPTEQLEVDTPFGKPSGPIQLAEVGGTTVALLARHGPGHRFSPTNVPYRANIYALKQLGVTHVIASTAVGSLREEIVPGHLVIADQVIDKTFRRANTFFDEVAVHAELASPFCPSLRALLLETSKGSATPVHAKATYVCMEGPQFSTRAESELHRSWGAHLIGMTVMPEAKLAREAELCYALVALPTDYDCWWPHPDGLSQMELLKEIIGNLQMATQHGIDLIRRTIPAIASLGAGCNCQNALAMALWTDKSQISAETKRKLAPILGRYLES